jgi:hypothetical protein
VDSYGTTDCNSLAKRLLEQALADLENGDEEAITMTEAALAVLRAGDLPESERDELLGELVRLVDEDDDSDDLPCTCPPALAARGGFTSRCPVHGNRDYTCNEGRED